MISYFTYAGQRSTDYGILIDSHEGMTTPNRDYEQVDIPGRNGTLTVDNGRYLNVDITYHCGIGMEFQDNMGQFLAWIMSKTGYNRLEDTYQTDYYRMARVKTAPSPSIIGKMKMGTFDMIFDCKPQKYLKTGETEQTFTSNGSITNPTLYTALPLIRVYGTGTLKIGSTTITINSAGSYTDFDCEIQDAFCGSTNCNGKITLNSGNFFSLAPGSNGIVKSGNISRVVITPRWWTL